MKLLFFDCETNGLPKVYNASYTDVDNWPRVTQLAWILTDSEGNIQSSGCFLIQPDGWVIPDEAFFREHGHSTARSLAEGVPIDGVLEQFMAAKMDAEILVAHNLNFDHRIVWAEIIRSGRQPKSGMHKICTMMTSTNMCRIPGKGGRGFKWPTLNELHTILFGKAVDGAHDALADVRACKDSFFELVRLGVVVIPEVVNPQV